MFATRIWPTAEFLLRLAFFAIAPFLIVVLTALFPVTGVLVQIGLAVSAFFLGEAVRRLAARSKVAHVLLRRQLRFEAYYRENPTRPFLYYVFYPLLFPYWLIAPKARAEFLLFKGYTLANFALVVILLGVEYVTHFPPELAWHEFWPIALGTFIAETVVVLMFLMPIVTTVVHLHTTRSPRRLAALLVIALVSLGVAIVRIERRRDPMVSYSTRARVVLRAKANPSGSEAAMTAALGEAWRALPSSRSDVDSDGKVEGMPLERARVELARFYKEDEAYAFDLWLSKRGRGAMLVVYYEARRGQEPIWLAMDRSRLPTHDEARLPSGAFTAMRAATK